MDDDELWVRKDMKIIPYWKWFNFAYCTAGIQKSAKNT
jgi:hypothetical protein